MSKINDMLSKIDEADDNNVNQRANKNYEKIIKNLKQISSHVEHLTNMFPERNVMYKGRPDTSISKYLYTASQNGTAKITNIDKIASDLENMLSMFIDLDSDIDRQCDNMGGGN